MMELSRTFKIYHHIEKQLFRGTLYQFAPLMRRCKQISGAYNMNYNNRNLSSQPQVADVQEESIPPETKKNAFVYATYKHIEDGKKQACYVTKSILKPGLPAIYQQQLDLNETELDDIINKFEDHLLDSMLFCYGDEKKKKHRTRNAVLNTVLNFLQTTWRKTSQRYPSNLAKALFYKQHVTAAFNRLNSYDIMIAGKPQKSFLMMSKDPLKQFASNDEIAESVNTNLNWDEVYQPVFQFSEMDTVLKTVQAFLPGSPFPNPHTLFIAPDIKRYDMKQILGQGILFAFAHAYAYAIAQPQNSVGMKQIEPVTTQCVINNGRIMTFICFQLNTLDFADDAGVKNFVWIDEHLELFDKAYLKIPGVKPFKTVTETQIYLDALKREPLEMFLKFVLN